MVNYHKQPIIQEQHKTPDQTPPKQSGIGQSTSSAPDGPSARVRNAMPYLSFQWGMCWLPSLWMGSQAEHRNAAALTPA